MEIRVFSYTLKWKWKPLLLLFLKKSCCFKIIAFTWKGILIKVKSPVYVPFKKYFVEVLSRFILIETVSTLCDECYIPLKGGLDGVISGPVWCWLLLGFYTMRLPLLAGYELFSPVDSHLLHSSGWVLLREGNICSALSLFVQQLIPLSPTAICVFPEVVYTWNGREVLTTTGFLLQPSKTSEVLICKREIMALISFPWKIWDKEVSLGLYIDWTKKIQTFFIKCSILLIH